VNTAFKLLLGVFSIWFAMLLNSCREIEIFEQITPTIRNNSKPLPFEIKILAASDSFATISWGPVYDVDKDILYASIYLNDSLVISDLVSTSLYKFQNLKPNISYNGKIIVTDKKTDPVIVQFEFSTQSTFYRFDRLYDGYDGNIPVGNSIIKSGTGDYVVVGNAFFGEQYSGRGLYIAKFDKLGFEKWHTIHPSHEGFYRPRIIQSSSGDYLIANQESLVRVGEDGNLIWRKSTEDNLIDRALYNSVIEISNNNLLVVGTENDNETTRIGVVSKFTKDGELLWRKNYKLSGYTEFYDIVESADGQFIILGESYYGTHNIFLTKIDEEGDIHWEKTYSNNGWSDIPERILLTKDGGYIIAANRIGERDIVYTKILKTDNQGNLVWENQFLLDEKEFFKSYVHSLIQTFDESFVWVGSNGYTKRSASIVKISSTGQIIWKRDFFPQEVSAYLWTAWDVVESIDLGLVVLGHKNWYESQLAERGLWIYKTDQFGF